MKKQIIPLNVASERIQERVMYHQMRSRLLKELDNISSLDSLQALLQDINNSIDEFKEVMYEN